MPSLCDRVRAARGVLVVLAVLAGLVLLVGPRCADGMDPMMPMAGGSTMTMSHHTTKGHDTLGQQAEVADDGLLTVRVTEDPQADTRQDEHGGGLLAACLAFVAAALVALVKLPRAGGMTTGGTGAPRRVARARPPLVTGRAPDLTGLCILRI